MVERGFVRFDTALIGTLDAEEAPLPASLRDASGLDDGALSGLVTVEATASRAVVSDADGKLGVSAVTSVELGYLDGVTSSVQDQITAKAAKGANSDITSLAGLTTPLSEGQGGTGLEDVLDLPISTATQTALDLKQPTVFTIPSASGDGTTDDEQAFTDAVAAGRASVFVEQPATAYYFTTEPDLGTGSFMLEIEPGTIFTGPGSAYGNFRMFTQDGNIASGPWIVDRRLDPNRFAGTGLEAFNAFSVEAIVADPVTPSVTFTGTLTNGSAVITSVSSFVGLEVGSGLESATVGLATGYDYSKSRIVSMNQGAGTITMSHNFTGSTTPGATITATFLQWKVGIYGGGELSSTSPDAAVWGGNTVVKAGSGSKGLAFGWEIDLIVNSADAVTRGLLISGHGSEDADVGLEMNRGSTSQHYFYGIKAYDTHFGVDIEADNTAVIIRTTDTLNRGIVFDNIFTSNDPTTDTSRDGTLFAGQILANGAPGIYIRRNTDTAPTGNFITLTEADGDALMQFKVNGTIDIFQEYQIGGLKVMGYPVSGWGAATGTATRTTFDTSSVTLPQLAERVKAVIDDQLALGPFRT